MGKVLGSLLLYLGQEAKKVAKIRRKEGFKGIIWRVWRYLFKAPRLWRDEFIWFWKGRKGDGISSLVNGRIMFLNPFDRGISKELFIYRTHEPLVSRLLMGILREGMAVVDIGANIGYYVLIESGLVGDKGKVIAIEPDPENVVLLRRNVEANELRNVEIIQAAIGEENGIGKLYRSGSANWHSLLPSYYVDEGDVVDVNVYTLDSLVEEMGIRVDMVRMDLEGYEVRAIRGMEMVLERDGPILVVELHPHLVGGEEICSLLNHFKSLRYEMIYVVNRSKDFAWVRGHRPMRMAIDELIKDIISEGESTLKLGRRCVTAFLARLEDGGDSSWWSS